MVDERAGARFDGASWELLEPLSVGVEQDVAELDVALGGDERGIVVWPRGTTLLARRFDPVTGFASEETLPSMPISRALL